jgi:hypothetical protein
MIRSKNIQLFCQISNVIRIGLQIFTFVFPLFRSGSKNRIETMLSSAKSLKNTNSLRSPLIRWLSDPQSGMPLAHSALGFPRLGKKRGRAGKRCVFLLILFKTNRQLKVDLILVCFLFLSAFLSGQTNTEKLNAYIERMVEQTVSSTEREVDIESIIGDLEYLYTNPLNLNAATPEELDKLWVLNDFQIQSLIDYRKIMGQLVSIHELNYVYGFNEEITGLITPYIFLGSSKKKETFQLESITNLKHELVIRAGQQNANSNSPSVSEQKYLVRYKARSHDGFSIGLIAEKDAGEDFFSGSNPNGFDFYSGFIHYQGNNIIKSVTLGDYKVRAGQGLLIWPGYSTGKSSQVSSVQKRGQGITGNTSADEYGYFRGGALAFNYRKFGLSVFGSYKYIDATFDTLLNGIQTIRDDGLHRTNTEIQYEKNTTEQLFGTKLNYTNKHFLWGLNLLNVKYSNPLLTSEKVYQHFNFSGSNYSGFSTDYKLLLQKIQVYGEIASTNTAIASINGINLMPNSQFITSLVYRNYQKNYFSPYSNALAENSSVTNEEGLYAGVNWNTNWKIRLSGYADIFYFPWAKYGVDGLSGGKEYLLESAYSPNPEFEIILRYKYQEKDKNFSENDESEMNSLLPFVQNNIRLHFWYSISTKVSMATRYESAKSGFSGKEMLPGYLLYQNISYKPNKKIQINFRYAWFDISDYNSRIYAYESNVRYAYSMPAYYGKGTRTYLVFQYKALKFLSIWFRFSYTNNFDEELSNKQEATMQLLLKF